MTLANTFVDKIKENIMHEGLMKLSYLLPLLLRLLFLRLLLLGLLFLRLLFLRLLLLNLSETKKPHIIFAVVVSFRCLSYLATRSAQSFF